MQPKDTQEQTNQPSPQPTVNAFRQNLSTHSHETPRIAKVLIAVSALLGLMAVGFVGSWIIALGSAFWNINDGMDVLQAEADKKQQMLSSLVILDNTKNNAKGVVDGDGLTADRDPKVSTYASAKGIRVNRSFDVVTLEIARNLQNAGYIVDGNNFGPYYNLGTDNNGNSTLETRYIKGDTAVKIDYIFNQKISCPVQQSCYRTPKSHESRAVLNFDLLSNIQVTNLDVDLADKVNYSVSINGY